MVFSDLFFLFAFIPAFIICYLVAGLADKGKDAPTFKNTVLVCFSLIFYAWGEPIYVFLMLVSVLINYKIGIWIDASDHHRKVFIVQGIVCNVLIIGIFKYAGFFATQLNNLGVPCEVPNIALPIGISFYTFQLLSYEVDVYRGTVPAQKNLIDFGTYVAMFPQLIAGPIVRYSDIENQLKGRVHTLEKTGEGITRFVVGLGKKILLANQLGELTVLFRASQDQSVSYYWLYAVAFMLQIYYDFSGYSDMAIGLGKIFGFDFNENFNYPYVSKSITEFWRRWHISLGSWFRDYVYIPLGGNRRGTGRQFFNIFVVWMLTGFWHGAAWNFVLWGIYFAILLMIEKWFLKHSVAGHIYTLIFVLLGFVLFNASSLSQTVTDVKSMFGFTGISFVSTECLYYLKSYAVILILALIGTTPLIKNTVLKIKTSRFQKVYSYIEPLLLLILIIICTAYLVDGSFNPFLYFRF